MSTIDTPEFRKLLDAFLTAWSTGGRTVSSRCQIIKARSALIQFIDDGIGGA